MGEDLSYRRRWHGRVDGGEKKKSMVPTKINRWRDDEGRDEEKAWGRQLEATNW